MQVDRKLEGQFNDWTIISDPIRINKRIYYNCKCKCGAEKKVEMYNLHSGRSQSCRKCSAKRAGLLRDNLSKHWLYSKWIAIKTRCYNEKQPSFKHYGALGIKMHDKWIDDFNMFKNYIEFELGLPLNPYLTIDRINNKLGYIPCNLRWAVTGKRKKRWYDSLSILYGLVWATSRLLSNTID